MKMHIHLSVLRSGMTLGILLGAAALPMSAQTVDGRVQGGFASGISVLPPQEDTALPVAPAQKQAASAPEVSAPSASPEVAASAPVLAPIAAAPPVIVGCGPVSDHAMALDLAAMTAQSKKIDFGEQIKLFKEAVDQWAQAAIQCSGQAQLRATRNRDDDQQILDRLAEKLDSGPQCGLAHKNATMVQDLARQALSERRWEDASAVFRKAENTWDLAMDRCTGSEQDIARRHREQSVQDGHNAKHCAPLFEKAREYTQRLRASAATITREDKQDASMVAETLWREALAKCKGSAVLEIAANNANALARERGTPWVARLPPAAPSAPAAVVVVRKEMPPAEQVPRNVPKPPPVLETPAPLLNVTAASLKVIEAPVLSSSRPGLDAVVHASAAPRVALVEVETGVPGNLTVETTRFVGKFLRDANATSISGTGKVTWASGDVFEGGLVKGQRQGVGTMVWANGQTYTGDWVQDKATGQAKVHFFNGNEYEGQVMDGKPQGVGRMQYVAGDQFEGQFTQGDPDVRGVYVWRNGQRYEGSWKNTRPNGQGKLKFATGNVYEGQVVDGVPQGQGRMVFTGGEIYEGQLRHGEPDGEGSFIWPSGDRYVGQWQAGKKHGRGVFTWKGGQRWEGIYDHDVQSEAVTAEVKQ